MKSRGLALCSILAALGALAPARASNVSINFSGGSGTSLSQTQYDGSLSTTAWGGLFAENEWNNSPYCTQTTGTSGSLTGLVDSTGTVSPITIEYSGSGWWNSYTNTTGLLPNQVLMDGYLDNYGVSNGVSLQDLPAGTYQIIVYLASNASGRAGGVRLTAGTNSTYSGTAEYYYSVPSPTPAGTNPMWVRAVGTSAATATPSSNYVEFDNVAVSAAGGAITLNQTVVSGAHSGIAAIQILGNFDFRPGLSNAISSGLAYYRIPPGSYTMTNDSTSYVEIPGANNLVIDGSGVTLIGAQRNRMLNIANSTGVTVEGLTIDYDPLTFTQGTVTSVASDNNSLIVTLDAGYPQLLSNRVNFYDPTTRFWSPTANILYSATTSFTDSTDTKVEIQSSGIGTSVSVGDLASLSVMATTGAANGVQITDSSETTLQDVTIYCAPGMGILELNGNGGTVYDNCQIIRGPTPAGATSARLLSTTIDAMQARNVRVGPTVENCTITSAGDDTWSMQSGGYDVVSVSGNTAVISFRDTTATGPEVGDTLIGASTTPGGSVVTWTITAEAASGSNLQVTLGSGTGPMFAAGATLVCPDIQGNDFQFVNNTVHSSGRIMPRAGGLVQGNYVYGGIFGGVTAATETAVGQFTYVNGLKINQNYFYETSDSPGNGSSAEIGCVGLIGNYSTETPPANNCFVNCSITNNYFDTVTGCQIGLIGNSGTIVSGNIFINPFTTPKNDTGNDLAIDWSDLVELFYTTGVTFSGNEVYNPGPYLNDAVVYGVGNDKTGSYSLSNPASGFTEQSGTPPKYQQPALP